MLVLHFGRQASLVVAQGLSCHSRCGTLKNWCFRTVMLGKTLESPLNCKEIKPVNPKGNQPCIFLWGTNVEPEDPILWSPDVKSWLIAKDPDAEDQGQEKKRVTEDKMAGWHHRLNEHEFEQTLGDSEGQKSLACFRSMGLQGVGHDWLTKQQ